MAFIPHENPAEDDLRHTQTTVGRLRTPSATDWVSDKGLAVVLVHSRLLVAGCTLIVRSAAFPDHGRQGK